MFGTFLFSINLNDLYLFLNETDFCNLDDDTALFVNLAKLLALELKLERNSVLVLVSEQVYEINHLITDTCHFLISGYKYEHQCS